MSPVERFLSKLAKTDACWNWLGAVNSNGYGQLWVNRRLVYVHRFSYETYIGGIPDGLNVLHRCDNTRCANPAHLYIGDQKQNGCDARDRARMPRGITHHAARLTADDVRTIRELAGLIPQTAIARRFGIGQQSVSDIICGKSWHHV